MPLPERQEGETHREFVDRCMGNEAMVREFPEAAQRRAVCESQWRGTEAMSSQKQPEFVTMFATATIEAASDEKQLPRFSMVAYTGGTMRIPGFSRPVVVDLAGLDIPNQKLPIRLDHERRQGVGHTRRVVVERGALVAEGLISRDTSWARDVAKSGANGFPWQASIGAAVTEAEFIPAGSTVHVNGQTFTGPLHVVRGAILKEISFVDSGADVNTSVRIAAQDKEQEAMTDKENTNLQTDTKEDHADAQPQDSQQAPDVTAGETDIQAGSAEGTKTVTVADPAAEIRAQAAAESKRIAGIRKVCDDKYGDIEAKAIEEGWDGTRCELEVLRASRPKAPAAHVPDTGVTGCVLEAACFLTAGLTDVEKLHDEKTLDVASKRFRGGIGLQELLLEAAWANGYTGRSFRNSREVLRFAFGTNLQAAFSTVDISGILSNVANKFLLEGF